MAEDSRRTEDTQREENNTEYELKELTDHKDSCPLLCESSLDTNSNHCDQSSDVTTKNSTLSKAEEGDPALGIAENEVITSSSPTEPLAPSQAQEENPEEGTQNKRKCPCIQKPEGKDAWVVAFLSLFMTFCMATEMSAFALFYVMFTEYYETSKAVVGWIKGIQTIAGGTVSVFAGTFIKVYGCRRVTMLAGCFLFLGMLGASLSPNIYVAYLTQGVILGIGISMTNMCVVVGIQQHFTRNKVLGAGISNFGFTVGGFSGPILASWLLEEYGLKGAMLIHAGVLANVIPCGLISRPPKKPKPTENETETKSKVPIRQQLHDELSDVSMFKEPLYVCILVSGLLTYYNLATFLSHFPGRAMFYGVSRNQAAWLQSITSIASSTARVPCTLLANIKSVNKVLVYGLGLSLMSVAAVVYGFCRTLNLMFISPVVFGIGVGSATTVFSVSMVYLFTLERLPKAFSYFNVAVYAGMTLGPPISGLIFDETNNYDYPFYLSGLLSLCGSIIVLIVCCLDRRARKKDKTNEKDKINEVDV